MFNISLMHIIIYIIIADVIVVSSVYFKLKEEKHRVAIQMLIQMFNKLIELIKHRISIISFIEIVLFTLIVLLLIAPAIFPFILYGDIKNIFKKKNKQEVVDIYDAVMKEYLAPITDNILKELTGEELFILRKISTQSTFIDVAAAIKLIEGYYPDQFIIDTFNKFLYMGMIEQEVSVKIKATDKALEFLNNK